MTTLPKRKLITLGGGGFSEESDNISLDRFIFSQVPRKTPKVCFVPTASGDAQAYIDKFYLSMKGHDVEPSHLSLFRGPEGSLRDFVMDKDVIYVGGGNTRNLMVLWKEWGLDTILSAAYRAGKIMGGISAGSLCWYQHGVTDSVPGELNDLRCLGFLKGSHCPHYDGETKRRPEYHRLILAGMPGGIACDNGAALSSDGWCRAGRCATMIRDQKNDAQISEATEKEQSEKLGRRAPRRMRCGQGQLRRGGALAH